MQTKSATGMGTSESIEAGAEVYSWPQTISLAKPSAEAMEAPPKYHRSIVQPTHFNVYDGGSSQPHLMMALPVLFDGYRHHFSIETQFHLLQLCKQAHLLLRSYFLWIQQPRYENYLVDFTFAWEPRPQGRQLFKQPQAEAEHRAEAQRRHDRDSRILRELLNQEGGDPDLLKSGIDGKLYSISFVAGKDGRAAGMLAYANARYGNADRNVIRYYDVVGWSFIPDRQNDNDKARIEGYLVRLELTRDDASYSITILPDHLFAHKLYSNQPIRSPETYKEHLTSQVQGVISRYSRACCD